MSTWMIFFAPAVSVIARIFAILTWEEVFGLLFMGALIVGPPVLFLRRVVELVLGCAQASWRRTIFRAAGTLVVVLCVFYGYFVEPRWVEYRVIRLPVKGISSGKTVRLAHLTDRHDETRAMGWPGEDVIADVASVANVRRRS